MRNNAYSGDSIQMRDEAAELAAFDRLPPAIKRALHEANYPYSAAWFHNRLNHGATVEQLVDEIGKSDRIGERKAWNAALADLAVQVARIKEDIWRRLVGRRRIR